MKIPEIILWFVLVSLQETWTLCSWFIIVHICLLTCVTNYLLFSCLRKSQIITGLLINFLKVKCFRYKYLIKLLRIHWLLNIQRWSQRDSLCIRMLVLAEDWSLAHSTMLGRSQLPLTAVEYYFNVCYFFFAFV